MWNINGFLSWEAKSFLLLEVFVLFELLPVSVGYVGIASWVIICFFSTAVSAMFACELKKVV